ncbi:hypothetical protein ACQ86N_47690 [Puia sp. P3]|uniref:hypothetical protein n=1 Tax=Puia sp. P3 TaxID=3423952 RepID=UPI003D6719AA
MVTRTSDISGFYVVGINYKKTDAAIRGQFAINNEQYERILTLAPTLHLTELFILSTCNRTEIYGFADNASQRWPACFARRPSETSTALWKWRM